MSNEILTGIVLGQLGEYVGKYQLTFHFFGEGINSVVIEKDGIRLFDNGCIETPLQALIEARDFLDRINRVKREYNPNF